MVTTTAATRIMRTRAHTATNPDTPTARRTAPTGPLGVTAELVTAYATTRLDAPTVLRALTRRPAGPWATIMTGTTAAALLHEQLVAARAEHDQLLAGWDDADCDRCSPTELCPMDRQRLYAWHTARDRHARVILAIPTRGTR